MEILTPSEKIIVFVKMTCLKNKTNHIGLAYNFGHSNEEIMETRNKSETKIVLTSNYQPFSVVRAIKYIENIKNM